MEEIRNGGLSDSVRFAARDFLLYALNMLSDIGMIDLRRVVRPQGARGASISLEYYFGWQSFRDLSSRLKNSELLQDLESIILQEQPELLGFFAGPGRATSLRDLAGTVFIWVKRALYYVDNGCGRDEAVERVLSDVDSCLLSRVCIQSAVTVIKDFSLPDGVELIELRNGVQIRLLSDIEITDLSSHDALLDATFTINAASDRVAIIRKYDVPIVVSVIKAEALENPFQELAKTDLMVVLKALHVLKAGRLSVSFTSVQTSPMIFPGLVDAKFGPLESGSFSSITLLSEDIDALINIHGLLLGEIRAELDIACLKLMDAENRMSPVDALIDAAIGLDVLFNPRDNGELSFRMAANYAFLGSESERRDRFEKIKAISAMRNKVVHGGLRDISKILPQANAAKECLRDAINIFLSDEELCRGAKLDADFWINRMMVVGRPSSS